MFIKHPLLTIPKDIKKETFISTLLGVITSLGFDFLSFFLQFGKDQVAAGHILLGLTFITIYYIKSVLHSSVSLWLDDLNANYREHYTSEINNRTVKLLLKVRGKVWRTNPETHSKEIMSTNAVILSSRQYLSLVWDFKTGLGKNFFQFVSAICMFIGFVMVTTIEIENSFLFILAIIIVSLLSVLISVKRISLKKRFKKARKSAIEEQDMAMNDVVNIEPVNTKHASYMADKYIKTTKTLYGFDKRDRTSINKIDFVETFINSLATILIISIKVYETGLEQVDLTTVLSIISLVTIYSSIIGRVHSIIRILEDGKGMIEDIKNYKDDALQILQVLDQETSSSFVGDSGKLKSITIPKFKVQYEATGSETPFTLSNTQSITLVPNDIALLIGPTGSGKSTLLKMVTRILKFDDFELHYERDVNGYIDTLMHQTDGRLGCNTVLSELVFDENEFDEAKLIYILKGLHLYEEISEKNKEVIEYLKSSYVRDYSTGQKQRLAIARLLYHLDDSVQVVAFDEATNALNDAITLQTLNFIKEFCTGKILLIATHQVDIGKNVATKQYSFVPGEEYYSIVPQ